jgi:hypothetical protein
MERAGRKNQHPDLCRIDQFPDEAFFPFWLC